jgi:hypothetical protein
MTRFVDVIRPTPFSLFDTDPDFQREADGMVTFVKRKLGDDILPVELTSRQIYAAFEEATVEYGATVNMFQIRSQLASLLGSPTGSSGSMTNKYPHNSLDFLMRLAEPYIQETGFGGSQPVDLCYIDIENGRQDYDLYRELKIGSGSMSGSLYFPNLASGSHSRLKVWEVFHFEPMAAQHFLLNASNVTNFLANEFNYESYVNSTVFYVLPIFEDVLRRGMMEAAARVRRSNYSYQITGGKIRIFPVPTETRVAHTLWMRVSPSVTDALRPPFQDDSVYGVSGFSNAPFSNIPYSTVNDVGRWWIREMTFAIAQEILGRVRSKFKSLPIPNNEVVLNGEELVTQAREKQDKLRDTLREDLDKLTLPSLINQEADKAEAMLRMLRVIPMRSPIIIG